MSANDIQVGGEHYKMDIEPWDAINSWGLGYFDGTAVKYLARWQKKNGVQDLQKAKHFIEKLIEVQTGEVKQEEPINNVSYLQGLQDGENCVYDSLIEYFAALHKIDSKDHNHWETVCMILRSNKRQLK